MEEKIGGGTGPKSSTANPPQNSEADSSAKPDTAAAVPTRNDKRRARRNTPKRFASSPTTRRRICISASCNIRTKISKRPFHISKTLWVSFPAIRKRIFIWAKRFATRAIQDGALREFAAALKLDPSLVDAQSALGVVEQRRGNVDEALTAFRQVIKAQPDNPDAHNNLGLALLQTGDADTAITEFQSALKLRPDNPGYQTNLGVAYLQKTDFDAAATQFQTALKATPQDPTLHYDLGLALKLQDQLPEATAEFRNAEQLDPLQADVHYTLGVTLWQQGDFPAAAEELQQNSSGKARLRGGVLHARDRAETTEQVAGCCSRSSRSDPLAARFRWRAYHARRGAAPAWRQRRRRARIQGWNRNRERENESAGRACSPQTPASACSTQAISTARFRNFAPRSTRRRITRRLTINWDWRYNEKARKTKPRRNFNAPPNWTRSPHQPLH